MPAHLQQAPYSGRNFFEGVSKMKGIGLAVAGLISLAVCAPATSTAQPSNAVPSEIARTPDGKPDLNGIWQALEPANWDIRPHAARAAPLDMLGASGAEPPSVGVVEGGEIPYLPTA